MNPLPAPPSLPRRRDVAHAHRARGGRVAAVLPIHAPRALLRAFGFLPIEVWGPPNVNASHAAAHLQPYVCSIVGNALSFLLSGGLDVADLVLVPHACDSLQGLGSILIDFVHPRATVLPLYLPRGQRPCDVDFLADELRALAERLQAVSTRTPTSDDLFACIEREAQADDLLARLHEVRARLPWSDPEIYGLLRSREFLPAEEFIPVAEATLRQTGPAPRCGVPVLLSGIVPEPKAVLEALRNVGVVVVGDDLACTGRRLYRRSSDPDPYRRLAESLLSGPPDPTRGSPIRDRLAHLRELAGRSGARGVIFYDVKFCEPELFDLPRLRAGLQAAGIPSIAIEVELNDSQPHQALTRIEAFAEMLA